VVPETNDSCTVCSAGNYLQPGTFICLDTCPSGTNGDQGTCTVIQDYRACLTFDEKYYITEATGTGTPATITADGGITSSKEVKDASDPLAVYLRGFYFDGTDDYMTIHGLTVSTTFTIEMWVRVDDTESGTLFSINRNSNETPGDEDFVTLRIASDQMPDLQISDGATQYFTTGTLSPLAEAWTHIAFSIELTETSADYVDDIT
jgi:hypothetical protein